MALHSHLNYPPTSTRASYGVLRRLARVFKGKGRIHRLIGGWVPFILCGDHAALGPHVGSNDIDVLLLPEPRFDRALDALPRALLAENFEPDKSTIGKHGPNIHAATWWFRNAGPNEDVKVEFLAAAESDSQSGMDGIVQELHLVKLSGMGGFISTCQDAGWTGTRFQPGEPGDESISLGNGAAAVMSKAVTFQERLAGIGRDKVSKDAYDLYYLITAYARGIGDLVTELQDSPEGVLRRKALAVRENYFADPAGEGAAMVADFIPDPPGGRNAFSRQVANQMMAFIGLVRGDR